MITASQNKANIILIRGTFEMGTEGILTKQSNLEQCNILSYLCVIILRSNLTT